MNKQKAGSRLGSRYLMIHEWICSDACGVTSIDGCLEGTVVIIVDRQHGHVVCFESHSERQGL
jgi:hypothetical protein